jgi:hypothetical protein
MAKPKRRVNRAFNCYIQPRADDIRHVERDRMDRIELYRQKRGGK